MITARRDGDGANANTIPVTAVALFVFSAVLAVAGLLTDVRAESVWSSAAVKWDCTSGERPQWDDMCMAWRKRMGELGFSKKRANYSKMTADRFADPSLQSWGVDNSTSSGSVGGGADGSSACMICTHGRWPGNLGWRGVMVKDTHGCHTLEEHRLYGGASGGKMRFLHLSSCHSIYWNNRRHWDGAAQGGVHVIMGFHGRMHIGDEFIPDYRHQASDGQNLPGVAWAWLENMYHADGFAGRALEQCPVSRSYGDTEDRAWRVLNERYGENLEDRQPKRAINLFYAGCQPSGQIDKNPDHKVGPLPE